MRGALWAGLVRGLLAVLLLAVVPGAGLRAEEGPGRRLFDPPAAPMLLAREVHRLLNDGNEIVVRRGYEIRFVPERGGYRVEGRLVSVDVSVPPRLQGLAALEKARGDEALFPLHLNARGMIVEQAEADMPATPQAQRLAESMIARAALRNGDKGDARGFIAALLAHPEMAGGHWPGELFHPVSGTASDANSYAMPDGGQGTIRVTVTADGTGPGGLMRSFRREIVTEAGGVSRRNVEIWTLGPVGR